MLQMLSEEQGFILRNATMQTNIYKQFDCLIFCSMRDHCLLQIYAVGFTRGRSDLYRALYEQAHLKHCSSEQRKQQVYSCALIHSGVVSQSAENQD